MCINDHALKTHLRHGWMWWQMKCEFMNEWTLHHPMYLCVKYVFNAWYPCMKDMNQYEQISHIILIIKSLDVKFVLCVFIKVALS